MKPHRDVHQAMDLQRFCRGDALRDQCVFLMWRQGVLKMRETAATDRNEERVAKMAADWQWNHRLLVVAADPGSEDFDLQLSVIAEVGSEWLDRDLLLIMLANEEGWIIDDPAAPRSEWRHLSVGEAAAFRIRYGLTGTRFEAALVGKDGGVKSRYLEIVTPAAIFPFIDAMPMRMDEIREDSE